MRHLTKVWGFTGGADEFLWWSKWVTAICENTDNVGMARCIHKEVYKELLHVLVGPENDFGVSALSAAQVHLKLRQSFDKDTGIYILHLPG